MSSVYGLVTLNIRRLHLSLATNSLRQQSCWESKNVLHMLASKRRKFTCGNEHSWPLPWVYQSHCREHMVTLSPLHCCSPSDLWDAAWFPAAQMFPPYRASVRTLRTPVVLMTRPTLHKAPTHLLPWYKNLISAQSWIPIPVPIILLDTSLQHCLLSVSQTWAVACSWPD